MKMNRKLIAIIALVALAGTGAFAQLAIGVTGAIYRDDNDLNGSSFSRAWSDLKRGDGYFGVLAEVGMDHLAVGLAANFCVYDEDWGTPSTFEMFNFDGNLYLQGHLFKYDSFLDPFLEAGVGYLAKDYRNPDDDPDEKNPLMASYYGDVGFGLGLNLGSLGFFFKGLYNFKFNDQPAMGSYLDESGNEVEFPLAAYPISNLKFIFGAKIIFD
jgi:hypothetical protein